MLGNDEAYKMGEIFSSDLHSTRLTENNFYFRRCLDARDIKEDSYSVPKVIIIKAEHSSNHKVHHF